MRERPDLDEALRRAKERIASERLLYPEGSPERISPAYARPNMTELTSRETDVLRFISHGMTVGMAAEMMGIKEHTARSHVLKARMKLRAKTKTHAVAIAIREGIID